MGQVIDLTGKITNELPLVRITNDLCVTVNNRKSTIMNVQLMVKEKEKQMNQANEQEYDELSFMNKILEMLVGKKNVDSIEELDLPFPEYKEVYNALMGAATGTYGETPSR